MREIVQMQKVKDIIETYDGKQPLQMHLKNYFREHKEMGSRDRKVYTQLVYGYYREKGMRPHDDGFIVPLSGNEELLHPFFSYWSHQLNRPSATDAEHYFPMAEQISPEVDKQALLDSIHRQPAVWIRCKKEHITHILDELETLQYPFQRDGVAIRFDKQFPLQDSESFKKGYFEIQDIASQSTAGLFHPKKNEAWWDCCAGSGGKSLLLLEEEKQLQLFVSDNRESILHNLQDRFARAGVRQFAAVLVDIAEAEDNALQGIPFMNGIIADVPCSGSGTWARTPERLSHFTPEQLQAHTAQQRDILSKVIGKLLPGGQLVYITCSVYVDENENQVAWMQQQFGLHAERQQYFQYSELGGDTLFGALLIKPQH